MNAPLAHPVIPAAELRQEIAPAAAKPITAPAPVYIDLDTLDADKFGAESFRSSFNSWRHS